jgi:hypothetical protein
LSGIEEGLQYTGHDKNASAKHVIDSFPEFRGHTRKLTLLVRIGGGRWRHPFQQRFQDIANTAN